MTYFITTANRIFWLVVLCLTFIGFSLPSYALNLQDIPLPRTFQGEWVTDVAQTINADTKAQVNQMISEWERKTGDKIFIVTVPEILPAPNSQAFAINLFHYWGIGNQGRKNGLLFLTSVGDRRVEIRTSDSIRKRISDFKVGDIIQKEIIPQFKQDKFSEGILAGTKSLLIQLEKKQSVDLKIVDALIPLCLFLLLFIAIILLSFKFLLSPKKMLDELRDEIRNTEPLLKNLDIEYGGSSDGGGDGGSSDGGGDGGSSDGGGDGGGW